MNAEKELLKRKINVDIEVSLACLDNGTQELNLYLALDYAYEVISEYRVRGRRDCPCYNVGYANPRPDEMYLAHIIANSFDIDEIMADDFDLWDYQYTFYYCLYYYDDANELRTVCIDIDVY